MGLPQSTVPSSAKFSPCQLLPMSLCLKPLKFSTASWTLPKGQGARTEGADHPPGLQGQTGKSDTLRGGPSHLPGLLTLPSTAPTLLPQALFRPRVWLRWTYSFSGHPRSPHTPFTRNLTLLSQANRETEGWPRAEEVRGPLGHSPKPLPSPWPCCGMQAPGPWQAESQSTGSLGSLHPKKPARAVPFAAPVCSDP